jgi:transcription elongation factor Elf1
MIGEKYPIKAALIELVVQRREGKLPRAQFTCEKCEKNNLIPHVGESRTIFVCGYCSETNYLTEYEII